MAGSRRAQRQGGRAGLGLLALVAAAGLAAPAGVVAQGTEVAPAIARLVTSGIRSLGKPALQRDARLDAAALALLAQYPSTDTLPNQAVSAALWHQQVVEPIHRLLVVRYGTQSPEDMLAALPGQVRVLLGSGRWHRFGIGVAAGQLPVAGAAAPDPDGESRAVIVVLESFVQLTPPPPASPGEASVPLAGTLQPPYSRPKVVVTAPSGAVETPLLSAHGRAFSCPLRCAERGRYQVEVLGEDKGGPTVLANFPWYCGQAAPLPQRAAVPSEAEVPWRDGRDAEQQVLALLNQDRQRAGLPPLPLDPALSAVARAHCQDMAEHKFVAHLSPRSGGPADRVRRAAIAAAVVTENLAQARSPKEVQEGLMGSPGHRGNILDPRVSRVGIGAQEIVGVAGLRQLLVTQLFLGEPEVIDLSAAPARVVRALQAQRTAAQKAALLVDPELTALAARTAEAIARGQVAENRPDALIEPALPALRRRFATVRAALAVAQSPDQIADVPALIDAATTHIGVAVTSRPAKAAKTAGKTEAPALYLVILIARLAVSR